MSLALKRSRKIKHFSLVEILVVMIIMTLALSIAGPFVFEMVERNDRVVEQVRMKAIIDHVGRKAFTEEQTYSVELAGRSFQVFDQKGEEVYAQRWEYLTFQKQNFSVGPSGYASLSSIQGSDGFVMHLNTGREK